MQNPYFNDFSHSFADEKHNNSKKLLKEAIINQPRFCGLGA